MKITDRVRKASRGEVSATMYKALTPAPGTVNTVSEAADGSLVLTTRPCDAQDSCWPDYITAEDIAACSAKVKKDRHKPGYMTEYMRKRRAAK